MNATPNSLFGPLVTAMVTPFSADGSLDIPRAQQLAERLLENGSSGLVVCGTTGESPTLSHDEKLQMFRAVKESAASRDGASTRAPIIANVGSYNTAASVELAKEAAQIGIDALLAVVPYYNKPSQEGLFQHFKAIAEATPLPLVLYNLPGRTSRNMEAATVARLSQISNIVGNKEASGDLHLAAQVALSAGEDFQLYSGNDADTLPMLTLGARGVVSVISHLAGNEMRAMMDAFWNGDFKTARDLHLKLLPVCDALFPATSSNPAPLKAALQMQGFDCGGLRLPLVEISDAERATLQNAMQNAGLL